MTFRSLILLPALLLCGLACAAQPAYTATPRGVAVTLPGGGHVRLEAWGDRIVRVSATPDAEFAPDASLVTLLPERQPRFRVASTDSTVTLSTDSLRAVVTLPAGHVAFFNSRGERILAEHPSGRTFRPIEVEGTRGYTVTQRFLSPSADEAIYGLGQHQSDEFNYKGRDEELFQYNTKVSVPFVLSTERYGLLWDSYSLCRFGNPEPYRQLGQLFRLYDLDGREGALTGSYTPAGSSTPEIVRREDSIYFEHLIRRELKHVVNLPRDFNFAGSNVVYEGDIEPLADGLHRFILYYSGYIRVLLDGREVVPERWRTAWNPNAYKFQLPLRRGERSRLRIEWQPNGSTAYCGLRGYPPRPEEESAQMTWWGEMQDGVDYYFIYGSRPDDIIAGYRRLTGRAPIMPRWAMGYWQSREKYNTASEVLGTLAEFRRREIPIDNIVIDWLHWEQDKWGSHEFDRKRFPDPKGMVDSIHAMNARVMISVWPKFYTTTEHYREFDRNGWMYPLPVRDSIRDWVGPGYLGSFYDAYSTPARRLFWRQMQDHYQPLGFDAWWMDASEPNVRDCTDLQYRKDLITPTALGPSAKYFNAYGLMNAEAIYTGQRSSPSDARVFLLTRSGFAGQQRYSTATWSGDIATRWEDLRAQISAGLNFAASGIPYWTMDIGGFCVEDRYVRAAKDAKKSSRESPDLREWRELNTRWYQFGAFCPLFRAHGQWPYREIFNIAPEDHPAYKSVVYYTRLRYELMPYIYSLAGRVHFDDYTIMRPLAMDFPSDKRVRPVSTQYMFGPALMVAPVTEYGARTREVYFPAGSVWYDFYTSAPQAGGVTATVDAPYERIPLYVRGGAILPRGPQMQWSAEKPADPIDLYVYAGADGSFTLYEDEDLNYDYEQGRYAMIPISYSEAASTLTLGPRRGSYPGMLRDRRFNVILVTPAGTRTPIPVTYRGREVKVKL